MNHNLAVMLAVAMAMTIGVIYGKYSRKEPKRRPHRINGPRLTDSEWDTLDAIVADPVLRQDMYATMLMKQGILDLMDELDEMTTLFELQVRRMNEATALWRRENPGNDLVAPDLGDLLKWLIERGNR